MILSNIQLEIPKENPFKYDRFNRGIIAENLEKIINNTNGSLVLSIDSGWGKGKTTFIKMWKQRLENKDEHKIVYFNAWENDDKNDPLLALIGEMEDVLFSSTTQNSTFDKLKSFGKPLIKQAMPIAIKILTNGILDLDKIQLGDFNEGQITELAGKIGELEMNGYKKEKQAKIKFKEALCEYQKKEGKKVIFFIDELDRCRPTFAVETLERIKHLFSIDNFVFIIALDKQQLAYSIETLYGQKMDSNGYIKRFIDLEYCLPEPNRDIYVDFLLSNYELKNKNTEFFEKYLKEIIRVYDLSLRDLDKLFFYLKLVLPMTPMFDLEPKYTKTYLHIMGAIYSLFPVLKIKSSNYYEDFLRKDYEAARFATLSRINDIKFKDDLFSTIINKTLSLNITVRNTRINCEEFEIGDSDGWNSRFNLTDLMDDTKEFVFIKQLQFLDQFTL